MTTLADLDIPPNGLFATCRRMWIVASGAGELPVAFQEARGFHEPVARTGDFELVVQSRPRGMVKVENIILERFARPVGKHAPSETPQRVRKLAAGGFQMTLQAQLELPFRLEPGRIDNRAGVGILNMGAARPVAALAIDPFRNCAAEEQLPPAGKSVGCDLRIRIVAKETFPVDLAPEVPMAAAVVARIHGPESAIFRIPRDGCFDELTFGSLMQISPRVVARAQHELNFLLDHVCLAATGSELMAALIIAAATPVHGIIMIRSLVIISVVAGVILYRVFRVWPVERSSHASAAIAVVDPPMTWGARRRFEVTCVFAGDE